MPSILRHIYRSLWPDDITVRQQRFQLTVSGTALAAAWPPLPLGFLALAALVLPLDIISGKTPRGAFASGYLFAFVYHICALYWIGWVTVPGTIAAVAIISLYNGFVFSLYAAVYRRARMLALLLLPILWVGLEYFRTLLEIAFPWTNLSYTQWNYLPFLQICEYIGDLGLSFIIVVVNILIWRAWRAKGRRVRAALVLGAGLLVALPTIYGALVLAKAPAEHDGPITIALLQGNIDLETKWDPQQRDVSLRMYDSLATAAMPADLLVWPETAAPMYLLGDYSQTLRVLQTAKKIGVPMLVGTLDYRVMTDTTYEYFNAALQFDPDLRYRPPYHKMKLVPFAEAVSYGEYLPFLENLSLGWSDFTHGVEPRIYKNTFGAYGTLICYESLFPELVNQNIREGADFLVNITNDTWYGRSSGPYQHAVMVIFRAIENRIWIARAANSGFSFFVDKYGRIYNRSNLMERAVIRGKISPIEGRTFFNRTGPIVGRAGLLMIAVVSLILAAVWVKNKVLR